MPDDIEVFREPAHRKGGLQGAQCKYLSFDHENGITECHTESGNQLDFKTSGLVEVRSMNTAGKGAMVSGEEMPMNR